jgi:acyl-CoA synthetase (AMP-forming)/AMP-acid ligase II
MAAGNGSQLMSGVSQGEGVFLVSAVDGECVTYREMHELIHRVAARFRSEGIRAGSKVVVFAPAMPESALLAVSAFCSGLTVVPLDYTWPAPLLRYVVEQLQPTHLFCWTDGVKVATESGFRGRVILVPIQA